jgi:hypothetical protein
MRKITAITRFDLRTGGGQEAGPAGGLRLCYRAGQPDVRATVTQIGGQVGHVGRCQPGRHLTGRTGIVEHRGHLPGQPIPRHRIEPNIPNGPAGRAVPDAPGRGGAVRDRRYADGPAGLRSFNDTGQLTG